MRCRRGIESTHLFQKTCFFFFFSVVWEEERISYSVERGQLKANAASSNAIICSVSPEQNGDNLAFNWPLSSWPVLPVGMVAGVSKTSVGLR